MHFLNGCIGFLLVVSLCDAAVVKKRIYRNTEEILVPVAIIQDGEEIKEPLTVIENKNLATEAATTVALVADEKLEAAEAQRRIDEAAIVEEEIKEAVVQEQNKEFITALLEDNELKAEQTKLTAIETDSNGAVNKRLPEKPRTTTVITESVVGSLPEKPGITIVVTPSDDNDVVNKPLPEKPGITIVVTPSDDNDVVNKPLPEKPGITMVITPSDDNDVVNKPLPEKPGVTTIITETVVKPIDTEKASQVLVAVPTADETTNIEIVSHKANIRQATESSPTQTTTQQNFVQQLIQNSPLGQFFNQITGQSTQNQVASDESAAVPAPGGFNPVTAVQNAAQSVVNSTTQAFQGLQQFASNIGNQLQSTLSSLGGQQQDQVSNDATTARPPGPIQQLVNTFIGTPQQAQPQAPAQQGPLQGLLNIFQGNNRPANASPQPAKEPVETNSAESTESAQSTNNDPSNNEVRDSAESSDSLEDSVQPDELIVINDDVAQTDNEQPHELSDVPK